MIVASTLRGGGELLAGRRALLLSGGVAWLARRLISNQTVGVWGRTLCPIGLSEREWFVPRQSDTFGQQGERAIFEGRNRRSIRNVRFTSTLPSASRK